MRLNELKPKESCRIIKIHGSGTTFRRLLDMGCLRGEKIIVSKVAPLGDPMDIIIRGYHLSLRKNEAKEIEIEKL